MQNNWFRQRLTGVKKTAPMWGELADATQQIFTSHVEPILDRLRGVGSAFTMAPEDLERRIDELGAFFWLSDRVAREDWALALLQRQDEIHLKKTDFPLVSTIAREFAGMQVVWSPLYAPKNQQDWPYGSRFTTLELMEFEDIPAEDWFMTARGVIRVSLPKLSETFLDGATIDDQSREFESIIARFVTPLIPLHIVFDGAQYFIEYELVEGAEWALLLMTDIEQQNADAIEAHEAAGVTMTDIETTFPAMAGNDNQIRYNRIDAIPMDAYQMDAPLC